MKHFFSCLSVCLSAEDDDEGETAKRGRHSIGLTAAVVVADASHFTN